MELFNGIDIVSIGRIDTLIQNPRFLQRVYSPAELALWKERGENAQFLAGNYAAKEAFSKALGTGVRGFTLKEVQVLRDRMGKPLLHLTGNAMKLAKEENLTFAVSISHEKEYAVAVVTAWR